MISQMFSSSKYNQVLSLLDAERKVILNGPLADLNPIVEKREALMADLLSSDEALPEAFITALKSKAERNSALIKSSLDGIRSGKAHLQKLEDSAGKLHTYDETGARTEIGDEKNTRDERA